MIIVINILLIIIEVTLPFSVKTPPLSLKPLLFCPTGPFPWNMWTCLAGKVADQSYSEHFQQPLTLQWYFCYLIRTDSKMIDIGMAIQLLKYWTIYVLVGKQLHHGPSDCPPLPCTTLPQASPGFSNQHLRLAYQGWESLAPKSHGQPLLSGWCLNLIGCWLFVILLKLYLFSYLFLPLDCASYFQCQNHVALGTKVVNEVGFLSVLLCTTLWARWFTYMTKSC